MWFDQYAGNCIVSNFWLHCASHLQILTSTETVSAPTLARSNLICLSSLDWPSRLLLPGASALSCHLLADHPVSLHIVDWHWWKICHPVFYLWSLFAFNTHDTCYFQNSDSQLSYHLHCLHLTCLCGLCHHSPLSNSGNVSSHHLASNNKTSCWSSFVSFVASFHQSNFAILAICPHTLAGCVFWSGSEIQLCFRVHLPPFAGPSATVHSSLILQNAPPCYMCSQLSARHVVSVEVPFDGCCWWYSQPLRFVALYAR